MALKDGKRGGFQGRAPEPRFVRRFFRGWVHVHDKTAFSNAGGWLEYRQTIKGRLTESGARRQSESQAQARGSWPGSPGQHGRHGKTARGAPPNLPRWAPSRTAPHSSRGGFRMTGQKSGLLRSADRFRLRRRAENRANGFLRARKTKSACSPTLCRCILGVVDEDSTEGAERVTSRKGRRTKGDRRARSSFTKSA